MIWLSVHYSELTMSGLLASHTSAATQSKHSSACYVNVLLIVITFEMKLIYYSVTFAKPI